MSKTKCKVCIDAGHHAKYNANYNITPTYWESYMAWDLHLMLAEELDKYEGITVITTRPDRDTNLGVVQRGQMARGCDLFVSLHSNACDTESVDRPVVIYPVSGKCKALAQALATTIASVMQTYDEARIYQRWNSNNTADYYGVIRGAASVGVPGLIIEHSFHTNNRAARWLQSQSHLRALAVEEARLIATSLGCKPKKEDTNEEGIDMTEEQLEQFVNGIIDKRFPGLWDQAYQRKLESYQDNDSGKWSEAARKWAVENGIVAGVGTDTDGKPNYAWEAPLTREQYAQTEYRQHLNDNNSKEGGGDD